MRWAILDSNIYIDHWERGLHGPLLTKLERGAVIRHSSVVLSELRRGARTPPARKHVEGLYAVAHVQWEPTPKDWWEAGSLVLEIGDDEGWDVSKRRDFQNDVLIALTARRHGSLVATSNQKDFSLLQKELKINVLFA